MASTSTSTTGTPARRSFNHLSGRIEALDLSLLGERTLGRHAAVVARESNAVVDKVTLRMVVTGAEWLETTITLPKQTKQILIENRLMKLGVLEKESVYFAFPFAIDDPDPEYAITGGVTSLDAPHVPGSAQHMLAIRDWVGLQDSQGSAAWATVDAPLIELENIAVPYRAVPALDSRRPSPARDDLFLGVEQYLGYQLPAAATRRDALSVRHRKQRNARPAGARNRDRGGRFGSSGWDVPARRDRAGAPSANEPAGGFRSAGGDRPSGIGERAGFGAGAVALACPRSGDR